MNEDATLLQPAADPDATRVRQPAPLRPAYQPEDRTLPKRPRDASVEARIAPGSLIKNRFLIEERLGQGGMGTVYRARDLRREELHDSDARVALKFLNQELRDQPDALLVLQREARKAQRLAHPNIVTVYDFDRDGALVYLSMEHLEGEPLDRLIARHAGVGLRPSLALPLIERIAQGLAYAHEQGFVHTDLKPGNVFLTHDGRIKILDLGVAQAVRPAGALNEHAFDASTTLGALTPSYASPQALAGEPPAPSDDVYSLGCVAYEVLTGLHPFVNADGRKLAADSAAEAGLQLTPVKGLRRRQWQALRRALHPDAAERPADGQAFLRAIRPRPPLRAGSIMLMAGLVALAAASWWFALERSELRVRLEDLPPSLGEAANTLRLADGLLEQGRIDQALNLYFQSWESARHLETVTARDLAKLKVLADRRFDRASEHLLKQAAAAGRDEFRLMQLQLALEFLLRAELGTRHSELEAALATLERRLAAQPAE